MMKKIIITLLIIVLLSSTSIQLTSSWSRCILGYNCPGDEPSYTPRTITSFSSNHAKIDKNFVTTLSFSLSGNAPISDIGLYRGTTIVSDIANSAREVEYSYSSISDHTVTLRVDYVGGYTTSNLNIDMQAPSLQFVEVIDDNAYKGRNHLEWEVKVKNVGGSSSRTLDMKVELGDLGYEKDLFYGSTIKLDKQDVETLQSVRDTGDGTIINDLFTLDNNEEHTFNVKVPEFFTVDYYPGASSIKETTLVAMNVQSYSSTITYSIGGVGPFALTNSPSAFDVSKYPSGFLLNILPITDNSGIEIEDYWDIINDVRNFNFHVYADANAITYESKNLFELFGIILNIPPPNVDAYYEDRDQEGQLDFNHWIEEIESRAQNTIPYQATDFDNLNDIEEITSPSNRNGIDLVLGLTTDNNPDAEPQYGGQTIYEGAVIGCILFDGDGSRRDSSMILHELLHIFGLGHHGYEHNIMYESASYILPHDNILQWQVDVVIANLNSFFP